MAEANSIAPFPGDIDRDAFGHWFSGFTDGEGCFLLVWHQNGNDPRIPRAKFQIRLRSDDSLVLKLIQSYFQAGTLNLTLNETCSDRSNPAMNLLFTRTDHLLLKIVGHFENHPLYAKKQRDFQIWKQGVLLIWQVSQRPFRNNARKWQSSELQEFETLRTSLIAQRSYQAETIIPLIKKEPTLFD